MKKLHISLSILLFIVFPVSTHAVGSNYITMFLPETVIIEAIQPVLPLTLDGSSSRLQGNLTIRNISNLRITNQQISCHLNLVGNDLYLLTTVANQQISLKLGTATIDFDCDAHIRYDPTSQILYLKLFARGVDASNALQRGDIGQAMAMLLNGREFPLQLQDLQPIIADASNKIITISTKIVDIRAIKGALKIDLFPAVTARPKNQNTVGAISTN